MRLSGLSEATRRTREAIITYMGLLVVLIALIVAFGLTQPAFPTYSNALNILETSSALLIVSVGLTFTLLVRGFDLSIGGMLALSGVVMAELVILGMPIGAAILITIIGAALIVGVGINGFTIARLGVNFFVVTLGMLAISRGLALAITGGASRGLYEYEALRTIGGGTVGDVPIPVIVSLAVLAIAFVLLRYTGYGRMVYAVGGNPEAARLAGINVTLIRTSAYAISAGLAAIAGIIEAGRLAAAAPDAHVGIELTAAAAVLLGGTSFVGGEGGVFGTFLAVLFLGVLQNGLLLSGIGIEWQGVISGSVLIAAVTIERLRRMRAGIE